MDQPATSSWGQLRQHLAAQQPGEIPNDAWGRVIDLLVACWPDEAETSMTAPKLRRAESLVWLPPLLSLDVERHGATVKGSSRAEIQSWAIDLDLEDVELVGSRRRQLRPQSPQLDVEPLAKQCAEAIIARAEHDWVRWTPDGDARIDIGAVVPATNQATTTNRRRRFRVALGQRLQPHGWSEKSPGRWTQS